MWSATVLEAQPAHLQDHKGGHTQPWLLKQESRQEKTSLATTGQYLKGIRFNHKKRRGNKTEARDTNGHKHFFKKKIAM
jgi:hypothetical protein